MCLGRRICCLQGHATAIRIFKQIVPQLPKGTQLHLVGNLMPKMEGYLRNLTQVKTNSSFPGARIAEVVQVLAHP